MNQSLPGWTLRSAAAHCSDLVSRILATATPGLLFSIQVVTPRVASWCGRITTSSSPGDSTSWSRLVPRALAIALSWSRLIRRWPVSIRLRVDGLR